MQVAHIEDRALNAHLAREDRFADLGELSYTDLLSLEDDLSEGSQWSLLDDVKAAIAERESDAHDALAKLFVEQAKISGEVPMVLGCKVTSMTTSAWMAEAIGGEHCSMTVDYLQGKVTLERLIASMAEEYAKEQALDLLKAGFVAEVCHG